MAGPWGLGAKGLLRDSQRQLPPLCGNSSSHQTGDLEAVATHRGIRASHCVPGPSIPGIEAVTCHISHSTTKPGLHTRCSSSG